jgi:hypothetical protein
MCYVAFGDSTSPRKSIGHFEILEFVLNFIQILAIQSQLIPRLVGNKSIFSYCGLGCATDFDT